MKPPDIYNPVFVRQLFNEMSQSYGLTNLVSSFGFCLWWRAQCVNQLAIEEGMTICDLMCGMGECWRYINRKMLSDGRIIALDFCPEMCRRARRNATSIEKTQMQILEEDALDNSIESESVDCVVSTFGLKTFSDEQKRKLAFEIKRILKPRGAFSLLEISVPPGKLLRLLYMFYLNKIIPLIGKAFLGNPDNYRMLGIYTAGFNDCSSMAEALSSVGLETKRKSFFFGCASGVVGRKP